MSVGSDDRVLRFDTCRDCRNVGDTHRRVVTVATTMLLSSSGRFAWPLINASSSWWFSSIRPGETMMFELRMASTTCCAETLWAVNFRDRS